MNSSDHYSEECQEIQWGAWAEKIPGGWQSPQQEEGLSTSWRSFGGKEMPTSHPIEASKAQTTWIQPVQN